MQWYTQLHKTIVAGCVMPLYSLGYLELLDYSASLHRNTKVHQLDPTIAVHGGNMLTTKQPFRILQAHEILNEPVPKFLRITLHNAHPLVKQEKRYLHQNKKMRWIMVCTSAPACLRTLDSNVATSSLFPGRGKPYVRKET